MEQRAIIHVDMDAFFAAIEQRDHPEYRHRPVIVGGSREGRGVVSTASYEARKYGVHSAMSMHEAVRRCPDGVFLPVDGAKYRDVSQLIMEIFRQYTPLVEVVSVDEAFLDVTGSRRLFGTEVEIAHTIKQQIWEKLALTASVGISYNKFLAKLASEMDKPDGFYRIAPEDLVEKVWPLSVKKMMGIGAKTEELLKKWKITTIGQVAYADRAFLERLLGKQGGMLWELARGIDHRLVVAERMAKSFGREVTFQQDVTDRYTLETVLMDLCEDVAYSLRKNHMKGKTVNLKMRTHEFKTFSRAVTLPSYTAGFEDIFATGKNLLMKHYQEKTPIRLIGISVSHLEKEDDIIEQIDLFGTDEGNKRKEQLDRTLDQLNGKYGSKMVKRARQMANDSLEN